MSYTDKRLLDAVAGALATPALRERLARAIVDSLRENMGGARIYVPRPRKGPRNSSIRSDYAGGDGLSVRQLCHRYDLSRTQVYAILAEE